MADEDLDRMALAAGLATSTLDEKERVEAEALMASDPEFAALVAAFRNRLAEEASDGVSKKLWRAIESNLTEKDY
jgi:anti-sigma-K factor RskA